MQVLGFFLYLCGDKQAKITLKQRNEYEEIILADSPLRTDTVGC